MGWDAIAYVILVIAVWLFFKLLHTCISIPRNLNKTKDIESMLEQKVKDYENYLKEQEEKEKAAGLNLVDSPEVRKSGLNGTPPDNNQSMEDKWKERREFLAMLKKELRRVRDGGDPYSWGSLLDDDEENKTNGPQPSTSKQSNLEEMGTSKEGDIEEMQQQLKEESRQIEEAEEENQTSVDDKKDK